MLYHSIPFPSWLKHPFSYCYLKTLRNSSVWELASTKQRHLIQCHVPFPRRKPQPRICKCRNIKANPWGSRTFLTPKIWSPRTLSHKLAQRLFPVKNWSLPCFSSWNLNVSFDIMSEFWSRNWLYMTQHLLLYHHWLGPEGLAPLLLQFAG